MGRTTVEATGTMYVCVRVCACVCVTDCSLLVVTTVSIVGSVVVGRTGVGHMHKV